MQHSHAHDERDNETVPAIVRLDLKINVRTRRGHETRMVAIPCQTCTRGSRADEATTTRDQSRTRSARTNG